MKNILIFLLLISSLFATKIEFQQANKNIKRIMPENGKDIILSFNDSIKESKKCVVNISTEKIIHKRRGYNPYDPLDRFFGELFTPIPKDRIERALGSGVIISNDGYIVTNAHVIENADTITVILADDKKEYKAKIVGIDTKSDLAVIKIELKNLPTIKFADSTNLKEGDIVFAIGNPFGIGETTTQGIISALNKSGIGINDYENFIQTDASINPGNSGGALVDTRGALIGINTAIISGSGGNVGVGFAIPANMVMKIAKALIEKGRVDRGYLGVTIGDLNSELLEFYKGQNGALVLGVEEATPAEITGIKRGDLIIEINDKIIKDSASLKNEVGSFLPNDKIEIKIKREGKLLVKNVTLSGYENERVAGVELIDGLIVKTLSYDLKRKFKTGDDIEGVLITDVKFNSLAEEYGFMSGDIILQVERTQIATTKELEMALEGYSGKKRVFINRGGAIFILIVK